MVRKIMAAQYVAENGEVYFDKKRYMWLVSYLIPISAITGPIIYMYTGQELFLWLFVLLWYCVFPFADIVMGEDTSNPPDFAIPKLESDRYYRVITRLHVPAVVLVFIFLGWFVANHDLSNFGYFASAMLAGYIGGHGINIGHELGHKRRKLDKWMAKVVLAPAAYGHFFIEHNRGHHKHVATPEDPASAKMGESIYRFALRELPGGLSRAFQVEKERFENKGQSTWTFKNEFIQTMFMTFGFYMTMLIWLGAQVLPFLLLAAFWSIWQLTSANYVEHYGLKRKMLPTGRYERPQPHHSWNSNHVFSNWALFHLQRHSDHHANATRSYQSLRHFDHLPQLPNGYFGMFLVAYIPWLWFTVMDKRLVSVTNGKLEAINILPEKREALCKRFGLS